MKKRNMEVIIVANNDWNGFWYQRQQFAYNFAQLGYRVLYLNRTLQRWPNFNHFTQRIKSSFNKSEIKTALPEGIELFTPLWLPPVKIFRRINRFLVKSTVKEFDLNTRPILITYVPSFNTIDLIEAVNPAKVIYINVHNYDADDVLTDLIESEKELVSSANYLFADSIYNINRLQHISKGRKVYQSLPGVNYKLFSKSKNGNEVIKRNTLYYFGGIGKHLNLKLYNSISKYLNVIFIGKVDEAVKDKISKNIEIKSPVSIEKLPEELFKADILSIFYERSPYVDGVIPAKFFECLATGKPLLVSGLNEIKPYLDVVYDVEGSEEKALDIIKNLYKTETEIVLNKRDEIARNADWENRFNNLLKIISGMEK